MRVQCFTFSSVQSSSLAQSCLTLWDPMNCSMPGLTMPVHHQLQEFTQIHVHWVGDAIQPSHPLSSPSPRALNLSSIRGFSDESVPCIMWPKFWSFSFSISPSNEYSGLISFRMNWFDLLAVQRTLKSLLQHHSSKASILWCSAFFIIQPRRSTEWVGTEYTNWIQYWIYLDLIFYFKLTASIFEDQNLRNKSGFKTHTSKV